MTPSNVSAIGLKIGDRVRWESMIGPVRGEVKSIRLARNAAGELVPWIMLEYYRSMDTSTVELCGTEQNLTMMKFRVTFRDKE